MICAFVFAYSKSNFLDVAVLLNGTNGHPAIDQNKYMLFCLCVKEIVDKGIKTLLNEQFSTILKAS